MLACGDIDHQTRCTKVSYDRVRVSNCWKYRRNRFVEVIRRGTVEGVYLHEIDLRSERS